MKTLPTTVLIGALAGSVLLATAGAASAQSKTLQGETHTVTATIEAIDQSARTITVKDPDGIYETVEVPRAFARFPELKVGDKITARYYENVVVRVKKPGEAAVDVDTSAFTRGDGPPAGTLAAQRTVTVTITALDPKAKSITVSGPNNYKYSRRVKDDKVFKQLKVGDQLDMTWTNALLISADTPK
jgi:hypothetical protein